MGLRRMAAIALLSASVGAGTAWAAGANSITIKVAHHGVVGQRLVVTFTGHDSAPSNVVGTFVAAVLEPPLRDGGSRCRGDLGSTEQNHPASRELFFQKRLDPHHTGRYRVAKRMPRLNATGVWTVCAWQFNNDGTTSTDVPASRAQAHIRVVRPG